MNNIYKKKPVLAITVALLYLSVVVFSFIVMLLTADNTAMSGFFLVFVTIPWPLLITQLQTVFHVESPLLNGVLLLFGGTINAFILFKLIAAAVSWKKS